MAHATYLPLLLSSVNASLNSSDDSTISNTISTSQVDYLSHNWREEDVWHSWRNMTRRKNEIANGRRLENASWRTWWKKRKGLQTVSPETLNWLKDSDVTWLYGPLHTSDDPHPVLERKSSTMLSSSTRSTTPPPSPDTNAALLPKPILKHRTLADLLLSDLPVPLTASVARISSPCHPAPTQSSEADDAATSKVTRPSLLHTRSETNITKKSVFRRESPPRIIADDIPAGESPRSDHSARLASLSPTPSTADSGPSLKKHISFNTFVEQCIAIEKPSSDSGTYSSYHYGVENRSPNASTPHTGFYDYIPLDRRSQHPSQRWPMEDDILDEEDEEESAPEESEDDDDGRIEIKTRSRNSSFNDLRPELGFRRSSPSPSLDDRGSPYGNVSSYNANAPAREHVTIAPIAPTILKTSSSSHNSSPAASSTSLPSRPVRSPYSRNVVVPPESTETDSDDDGDVPLIWVPPAGSGYSRDFSLQDLDEQGLAYAGVPTLERRYEGYPVRSWIVSPPEDDAVVAVKEIDGFSPEARKARLPDRERGLHTKPNESLSPVETSSSNESSRSRSRSRNRSELLNVDDRGSSPQRGRSTRTSSRSRSRSTSSTRCGDGRSPMMSLSPPEDRDGERGRSMARSPPIGEARSPSRESSRRSGKKSGRVGGAEPSDGTRETRGRPTSPKVWEDRGQRNAVGNENSATANRRPDAAEKGSDAQSLSSGSAGSGRTETKGSRTSVGGPLAGIRGYIGSMWGS